MVFLSSFMSFLIDNIILGQCTWISLHWIQDGFLGLLLPIDFSSYTSQGACLSCIPFIILWGRAQRKLAYWLPLLVGCKSQGLLASFFTILGKMGDVECEITQIFHRTTTIVEILYWCHIFFVVYRYLEFYIDVEIRSYNSDAGHIRDHSMYKVLFRLT